MRSDDKNNNEACNGSNWNDTEECALAAPRWMAKRLEQGERGRLYLASRYELHDALLRTAGEQALGKWPEPFSGYCANVEANLLKDVPFSDLREALQLLLNLICSPLASKPKPETCRRSGRQLGRDDECPSFVSLSPQQTPKAPQSL